MGRTINSLAILPGFTRMSHKNIKLETLFNDSLENSYSKFKLVHEQLSWIRTNKEACFEAYLTETPYWNCAKKLYAFDKNINNWKVKAYIIDTGNKRIDKILAKELEDTLKIKYNLIEGGLNTQVGSNT